MHYNIRHVTRFTYESAISESVMEARMQPRTDATQRCLHFGLSTQPASRVMMYQDHQGNVVHHFNIPGRHSQLTVTAEALVACSAPVDPSSAADSVAHLPHVAVTPPERELGTARCPHELWRILGRPQLQPLCAANGSPRRVLG